MTAALRALPSESVPKVLHSRVHPIGVQTPSSEVMLIGSLLYSNPSDRLSVVTFVLDDDLDNPYHRVVFGLIRERARSTREVDAALLADDLMRDGKLAGEHGVRLSKCLTDAATCAAAGEAVMSYAAAVVGESYRRRYEQLGNALTELSSSLPEHELLGYLVSAGSECRGHSKRLTSLREASGAAA